MNLVVHIRDILTSISNTFLSIVRIFFVTKFFLKNEKITSGGDLVILGNGPSLKSSLKENSEFLKSQTLMAVNYFARTDEFKKLKPTFYGIISPEYFRKEEKEIFKNQRDETLRVMARDTTWDMTLIVPALARSYPEWKKLIANNSNITLRYVNTTPLEGFSWFRHWGFSLNLGMPRPHNVLIGCLAASLNMGFEKIYLLGADHSWLPEISVTQDNQVLLSQKHFYDNQTKNQSDFVNKPVAKPMFKGSSAEERRLHEVLEKFYISFKSYWVLREYAESKNVDVINATKGSYIDAFRKEII